MHVHTKTLYLCSTTKNFSETRVCDLFRYHDNFCLSCFCIARRTIIRLFLVFTRSVAIETTTIFVLRPTVFQIWGFVIFYYFFLYCPKVDYKILFSIIAFRCNRKHIDLCSTTYNFSDTGESDFLLSQVDYNIALILIACICFLKTNIFVLRQTVFQILGVCDFFS